MAACIITHIFGRTSRLWGRQCCTSRTTPVGLSLSGSALHLSILDHSTASDWTVAGIISLLNDYQITKGKPLLGFLNL